MKIPELKTDEWIEVLDEYQQELLKELLKERSEEEVLEMWLGASVPNAMTPFGGGENTNYLRAFKEEINKLLLGDERYAGVIKEFNEHATVTKFFVVSFLSNALAESMGVVAAVIAPLVVLVLGTIGKMGLNAYRTMLLIERDDCFKENN